MTNNKSHNKHYNETKKHSDKSNKTKYKNKICFNDWSYNLI